MLRMDRRGCERDRKDDGHSTSKHHTRPPRRAGQAVRNPRIDQGGENGDKVHPKRNDVDLGNGKPSWMTLDIIALNPEDH